MKLLSYFLLLIVLSTGCKKYYFNEGYMHGTTYHIKYKADKDYKSEIEISMHLVDKALSTFDSGSVISLINRNEKTEVSDSHFIKVFSRAAEISEITGGAFDITVAPLVNAWGFGFKKMNEVDSSLISNLMKTVGYKKVKFENGKIIKQNVNTMLDCSAIAKGYSVDVVSEFLENKGVKNYMVEIGGEVRAKGKNPNGLAWQIGIDKPIDDATGQVHELQDIIALDNMAVATSGNYRQFYEKNGVKYAHTINPFTGYPANSNMLSATVFAHDCMTADAFATAFMVMGYENSRELAGRTPFIKVYFIYSNTDGNTLIWFSPEVEPLIVKD